MREMKDEDFRQAVVRAIRLTAIATVALLPVVAWRMHWQSAVYLLVGAGISASGLYEWLQMMTTVMERMDAAAGEGGSVPVRPVGRVVMGFVLRMGLAVAVLYVTLTALDGSLYALAGGLMLGLVMLAIQAARMMRA